MKYSDAERPGNSSQQFWGMRNNPKSKQSSDPASLVGLDTTILPSVQNISPAERTRRARQQQRTVQENLSIEQLLLIEQDTQSLRSTSKQSLAVVAPERPGAVRRLFNGALTRLQEPQPEGLLTRGLQSVKAEVGLGLLPVLALVMSFGLLLIALFYYLSIYAFSYTILEMSFFSGLLLIFVPNLIRCLSRKPSRHERIFLLCAVGLSFYFVQFMASPAYFTQFDETLHWRTANDLLSLGHLFTPNTMLPVSPYYPGLEIITNAISTTTGLSTFYAGNIVVMAARLLITLATFLFFEKLTSSSRMASFAAIVYMINSHFLFFDAFYSYETLALPFAVFMLYIVVRFKDEHGNYRGVVWTSLLILLALNATHHMTSYVFDGLLLMWAVISFFGSNSGKTRAFLTFLALFSVIVSLAYAFLLPGNPVWSYLYQFFSATFHQLSQIIGGTSKARPLFGSAGVVAPVWDRLLMTASVALITFCIPFGLILIQRQHRYSTLGVTLGLASLLYPVTQAFRFTQFGAQITDRASAFLFLAIAYVMTILVIHFWPTRNLNKRTISLITVLLVAVFLGGVIVEVGPDLSVTPGPYRAMADARSIEPQSVDAALWMNTYLGSNNRIATDRINQMLMNTYGNQRVVTFIYDQIDISPIFYSSQLNGEDQTIIRTGHLSYLEVDLRLSTVLPLQGTYFEIDQPTQIISRSSLTKFNTITAMDRLFDSGDIAIYDTGALTG